MIKLTRPICPNPDSLSNGNYKHRDNKSALREANKDKCMYCESKIPHIGFAHIEHFRPKAADKYPELEFVWDNLGYVCEKCNNTKSSKFDEQTPGCERAELTIIDVGLNRVELLEKREEKLRGIDTAIKACYRSNNQSLRDAALNELKKMAEPDKEFSFFVDSFINAHDAQS